MHTPLTSRQIREVDRLAIETLNIPGLILMENAGRGAAEVIRKHVRTTQATASHKDKSTHTPCEPAQAAILCGGGNNGGDGYVIARHLAVAGWDVEVFAYRGIDQLTGDARINATIVQRMGIPIVERSDDAPAPALTDAHIARWRNADVIVDALLGVGFTGDVREPLASWIRQINAIRAERETRAGGAATPAIVAIDAPSGLDVDRGQATAATVVADLTITFVAEKAGFSSPDAKAHLGEVIIVGIGAPQTLIQQAVNNVT